VIATVVLGQEGDDRKALFAFPVPLPGSPFARALQARARLLQRLRGVLDRARAMACWCLPMPFAAKVQH
jgi:hypothetical protein